MSLISVRVHHSQFPDNVRKDLLESLRTGNVNHKFHYDSIRQAQKWLALHEAYSPARTDPDCLEIYNKSFQFAAELVGNSLVHVVGLGCGGGQKEVCLLKLLQERGLHPRFIASDVSSALAVVSRQRAAAIIGDEECDAFVCDLQTADDLPQVLDQLAPQRRRRILTFFGLIPNFEPREILPRLAAVLQSDDLLLFSANLAPGADYSAGVEQVLPLYENELTRDWLMTLLHDIGVEDRDGTVIFQVEDVAGLKRIAAYFEFTEAREVVVHGERISFQPGTRIRLFFSYRHTPATIERLLGENSLQVRQSWITSSQEEGVFLCGRMPGRNSGSL